MLEQIKLITQHPAFVRAAREVEEQVHAAEKPMTRAVLRADPSLLLDQHRLADAVASGLTKMRKRLKRERGLVGKYVGH